MYGPKSTLPTLMIVTAWNLRRMARSLGEHAVAGEHRQQHRLGDPFNQDDALREEHGRAGGVEVLVDLPQIVLGKVEPRERQGTGHAARDVRGLAFSLGLLDLMLGLEDHDVLDADAAGEVRGMRCRDDLDAALRADACPCPWRTPSPAHGGSPAGRPAAAGCRCASGSSTRKSVSSASWAFRSSRTTVAMNSRLA